jgi:transcriptional regulator with XRE-family HTH domain
MDAEWQEANPLRKWREERGVSRRNAAVRLDIHTVTAMAWERGKSYPVAGNMAKLARLLGDDVEARWTKWWELRPRPS